MTLLQVLTSYQEALTDYEDASAQRDRMKLVGEMSNLLTVLSSRLSIVEQLLRLMAMPSAEIAELARSLASRRDIAALRLAGRGAGQVKSTVIELVVDELSARVDSSTAVPAGLWMKFKTWAQTQMDSEPERWPTNRNADIKTAALNLEEYKWLRGVEISRLHLAAASISFKDAEHLLDAWRDVQAAQPATGVDKRQAIYEHLLMGKSFPLDQYLKLSAGLSGLEAYLEARGLGPHVVGRLPAEGKQ